MADTTETAEVLDAAAPADPSRRPDVLLRVRMPDGWQPSPWWSVGAFLAVSVFVILVLGAVPANVGP